MPERHAENARREPRATGPHPEPRRGRLVLREASETRSQDATRQKRIGLYGGSFDPIHLGHLAVARAAMRRCHLDQILFIPTGRPPLKSTPCRASYIDRYAMMALAIAGEPRFVVSSAEGGEDQSGRRVYYSVDTVGRFREKFPKSKTHLFFLMGADSFLQIQSWKNYRTLLDLCDFIVANRPGFALETLKRAIPPELLARDASGNAPDVSGRERETRSGAIALRHSWVYSLPAVASPVSATEIRRRVQQNASIRGLVPLRVEEYITKQALYR